MVRATSTSAEVSPRPVVTLMVTSVALTIALSQVPVEQPPRLRTFLPNGATVLVERVKGAKTLAVGLYASSRAAPDTPINHGHRHLLEHLVAVGKSGELDRRLETNGGFMRARTLRDAIAFEFTLPPGALQLGLEGTRDILAAEVTSADLVRRELKILGEEEALRGEESMASEAAWRRVYGRFGLDPFGSLEAMKQATPASLERLRNLTFAGPSLSMTIVGDIDLDAATKAATDILLRAPAGKRSEATKRVVEPSEARAEVTGAYRVLPVRGYRDPHTAAALAAALALASELERATVLYTPSGAPGLILVGTPDGPATLERVLKDVRPADLFTRGRELARRWVHSRLIEPQDIATFRGLLLAEASDLRPETLLENLEVMRYTAFASAFESLRADSAIRIGGEA